MKASVAIRTANVFISSTVSGLMGNFTAAL